MDLDSRSVHAVLDEEAGDLAALIALELDDLTHLLIFNQSAITSEFLEKRRFGSI